MASQSCVRKMPVGSVWHVTIVSLFDTVPAAAYFLDTTQCLCPELQTHSLHVVAAMTRQSGFVVDEIDLVSLLTLVIARQA